MNMMDKIILNTKKKFELIDITKDVEKIISKQEIKEGFCILYVPHATASIIINESHDPNVKRDIINILAKLVPDNGKYLHDKIDGNAQAHIKASLLPTSQILLIEKNKLKLGTWQEIQFVELDGPRSDRTILIKIIK